MITLLEIALAILIVGSICFYLACTVCVRLFFKPSDAPETTSERGVSILVPVCGLDAGAWENWSSLCKQDYPDYEVLFGAVAADDPAVPVVQALMNLFPDRVRLFTNLPPRGINHKDSTLTYLLDEACHDIIIFADSDIKVSPDYIWTVTSPLADPRIGMVTCSYLAHQPKFFTAALASLGRGCDFIPSVLLARVLDNGLRFAIGVTIAIRRSALADAGGLHLNRIGSDYNLGKRVAQAGYRVELSREVLESDTGRESVEQLFRRELRWARTIRFNRGPIYYTMVFCYGLPFCLPLLLVSGFEQWAIALTLVAGAVRYGQAMIAVSSMNAPQLVRWLWALPFRDGLSLVIWAIGAFGQTVHWRGRTLRIIGDGVITDKSASWLTD